MTKLNADQIIELIKRSDISVGKFAEGDFSFLEEFLGHPEQDKADVAEYGVLDALSWRERREKGCYDRWRELWMKLEDESLILSGIGRWNEVEQYGGQNCGSNWYSIKHFYDHDVFIKTTGYYQSDHGTDFHEGYGHEVKLVKKTVKVYE